MKYNIEDEKKDIEFDKVHLLNQSLLLKKEDYHMRNKSFIAILVILCAMFTTVIAQQTDNTFQKLLCKGWTISSYFINGEAEELEEDEKQMGMIFYLDNSLKMKDGLSEELGTWTYDMKTKKLTIYETKSKESTVFIVAKLTENELVIEVKEEDDQLKIVFVPVK